MTANDARLFWQKIHALRGKHNFPTFDDLLRALHESVPMADYLEACRRDVECAVPRHWQRDRDR
jgi:hypothetical protein